MDADIDIDADSLEVAAGYLREARDVVVFSGAGASAESNIPTFRDDDGFWRRFPPDQYANWLGLLRTAATHPRKVAEFILELIEPIAKARPNPGHYALAEIEKHSKVTVVTQNIDGLHQEAGSTTVHEVHGSLFELVTLNGKFVKLLSREEILQIADKLRESIEGRLAFVKLLSALKPILGVGFWDLYRPKVVLFGDPMCEPDWTLGVQAAQHCDCMITVGTSCVVYPAAMLPEEARACGARIITVDPEHGTGDVWLKGPSGRLLPALVRQAFR
jgi:NAD-dependent deacetylase